MYMPNRHRLPDMENELVVTKGEGSEEGQIKGMGLTDTNDYIYIYTTDMQQGYTK